jgi:hypothetical protein
MKGVLPSDDLIGARFAQTRAGHSALRRPLGRRAPIPWTPLNDFKAVGAENCPRSKLFGGA